MKTKNLIISGLFLIIVVTFVINSQDREQYLTGYIPKGEVPKIENIEISRPLIFDSKTTMHVVIGKDTVLANLSNGESFSGSCFIFHKEEYQVSEEQTVFVRVYKKCNQYYIDKAFLNL